MSTGALRSAILGLMTADDRDQTILLRDVSWAQYEALLASRGESSVPRLTFLEGQLELMSPSRPHEGHSRLIGLLLHAYAEEHELSLNSFGAWTLKSRRRGAGLEPDECFLVGSTRGRTRPQLAIEVIWSHRLLDKLEAYRRLGVREVWIYAATGLNVYVLRGKKYARSASSRLFPELDLDEMLSFMDIEHQTEAVRAWRRRLRRR
jgi:Uma2 family endonuclease